jgi:hypothetical protein
MTNGVPNIVPAIGGLMGIGIMAATAGAVIGTVEQQINMGKRRKVKNTAKWTTTNPFKSFSDGMDERIKRMI